DLGEDERFRTNPARVEHREELRAELRAVFATLRADEWLERLEAAGVPAGKVRGMLEALREGSTLTVDHPTIGSLPLVPSPLGPAFGSPLSPPLPAAPLCRRRCSGSTRTTCWPSSATTRTRSTRSSATASWRGTAAETFALLRQVADRLDVVAV